MLADPDVRVVVNALRALHPRPRYTPEAARRLAFVHLLHARLGLPLARAYALAREALAAWPEHKVWEQEVDDTIALRVDLERFLSGCSVRLSLSRALAVRAFLIDRGVRSTRMDVRALGNKFEKGPGDRVDLIFAKP